MRGSVWVGPLCWGPEPAIHGVKKSVPAFLGVGPTGANVMPLVGRVGGVLVFSCGSPRLVSPSPTRVFRGNRCAFIVVPAKELFPKCACLAHRAAGVVTIRGQAPSGRTSGLQFSFVFFGFSFFLAGFLVEHAGPFGHHRVDGSIAQATLEVSHLRRAEVLGGEGLFEI